MGYDWLSASLVAVIINIEFPLHIKERNGSPSLISEKTVLCSSFSKSLKPFASFTTSTSSFQVSFSFGVSGPAVGFSMSSLESPCAYVGR